MNPYLQKLLAGASVLELNDPRDMTSLNNTALDPSGRLQYEAALQRRYAATGRDASRDAYDYDIQGALSAGAQYGADGHLTDRFKKPNHPTFSDASIYSVPGALGGQWTRDAFQPSMAGALPPAELERYMREVEPGMRLDWGMMQRRQ